MKTFRTLALRLSALFIIAGGIASLVAQAPPITAPGSSMAVRIAMYRNQVPLGQSPVINITIGNTSNHVVLWKGKSFRVHVEGISGEPAKTMWYRRFLREPGLPALGTNFDFHKPPSTISPAGLAGDSIDSRFYLSAYYNLDVPGSYSVYLEIEDDQEKWLTSDTVQFEILPPKQ